MQLYDIMKSTINAKYKLKHFDTSFCKITPLYLSGFKMHVKTAESLTRYLNTGTYRRILRNRVRWDIGILLSSQQLPSPQAVRHLNTPESRVHSIITRNILSIVTKPWWYRRLHSVPGLSESSPGWSRKCQTHSPLGRNAPSCQQPSPESPQLTTAATGTQALPPRATAPSSHVVSLNFNVLCQVEKPASQIFHFISCILKDRHYYGAWLYHEVQSEGEREMATSLRAEIMAGGSDKRGRTLLFETHLYNEVTEPSSALPFSFPLLCTPSWGWAGKVT